MQRERERGRAHWPPEHLKVPCIYLERAQLKSSGGQQTQVAESLQPSGEENGE